MKLKFWEKEVKIEEKSEVCKEMELRKKKMDLQKHEVLKKERSGCSAGVEYCPSEDFSIIKLLNTNEFPVKILVKYVAEDLWLRSDVTHGHYSEVTIDYFILSPGEVHYKIVNWDRSCYSCFIIDSIDLNGLPSVAGIIRTCTLPKENKETINHG
jgi:hypothetical protein